jgi:hypothetical protein
MVNRLDDSPAPDPRGSQQPAETVAGLDEDLKRVDYLYQEHARLSGVLESLSRSTFGDIELFVATVGVIASPVLARSGLFAEDLSDTALLVALLGVLLASGAVGLRNLLKISVMRFYLRELVSVDEQIRIEIGKPEADAFGAGDRWPEWERQHFAPIALRLNIVLGVLLGLLPVMILVATSPASHVGIYTGAACFVLGAYLTAARQLPPSVVERGDRISQ